MRSLAVMTGALLLTPGVARAAQEGGSPNLLSPAGGLMFWTLLVFLVLMFVLSRFAFKPLLAAVEARERSLRNALEAAEQSMAAANRAMDEAKLQLENARSEAQRIIAEGRTTSEKMKAEMLEATRLQQQELMERAKRDIEQEKVRAIAELRREAVDLAIAGASKVIEKNLDSSANRQLVESFLGSIPTQPKR